MAAVADAGPARTTEGSGRPSPFRLLVANRLSALGLLVLTAIIALVLLTPVLPLPEPNITDPAQRLLTPARPATCSAPTIWAATCCPGCCGAPGCRSSSGSRRP